jgi:serine protease Do
MNTKEQPMNKRTFGIKPVIFALAAGSLLGGSAIYAYQAERPAPATPAVATATLPVMSAPSPGVMLPDFTQITQKFGPAVVNISVSGVRNTSFGEQQDDESTPFSNDPFFQFFRRQFQGHGRGFGMMPRNMPSHGEGSGFLISPDGLILTNAHVVRDADEVVVKLTDRREFHAKVLGSDPKTDVALIKIDAKNLPTVPIGNPASLKVGEWVLAIGSPFGFENSVTAGIVSAKGRSLPDENYVPFIQTDVAVNPGNSGGPLLNTRGEVVGINSQIYSQSGGYQGLSFAIPIDVVMHVKDQLLKTGHATHARLGVSVQEVYQTLADSFGLGKPEGALVSDVEKGSPADNAGIQSGDVIRSVNGKPIVNSIDLPSIIGESTPGEQVSLGIWRSGKTIELTAKLADAKNARVATDDTSSGPNPGKLGLALRPLQPDEKQESGLDGGLLVEDVTGAAERAGVQPGDVILSVNGSRVKNVEQVRGLVAKAGKSVALLIQRGDSRIFVPVRIG